MKKRYVCLFAVALMAAGTARAADTLCAVVPTNCKILAEDDDVRIFKYTSKKGQMIPMHTHPKFAAYILKNGGMTKRTNEDGTTSQTSPGVAGQGVIGKPVTHSQETLEDEEVIIVEIKTIK